MYGGVGGAEERSSPLSRCVLGMSSSLEAKVFYLDLMEVKG